MYYNYQRGGVNSMNRKKIKKITSPRYYLIIIGIVFLALALLSSLVMGDAKENENKKPFSYPGIANTEYDVAGGYVYLDITDLYQFGIRETTTVNEEYYFAFDKDMYIYVVGIREGMFEEIEKLYSADPENFSYRLVGYLCDFKGDIRQLAIEMIPEVFGGELNYLVDDFDNYFLSTYLDTINSPAITPGDVILVSAIYFIIGCVFFIVGVLRILKVGKFKQNKDYFEMIGELEDPSIWNIGPLKVALTKSYLVYYGKKIGFVNYRDIKDLILDRNRLCLATDSEMVNIGKCNNVLYEEIKSYIEKKKNVSDTNEI